MRKSWIAPVVFIAALGCQKDEPLQPHQGSDAAAPPAVATAPPMDATTPASTATTAAAPAATAAPSSGIASADGEQAGVSLNVTEFKRTSGDTVTLKFVIVNGGAEPFNFGYALSDPALSSDYGSIGGVHLIDPVAKKKYFVVRDDDKRCLCSRELTKIEPGKQLHLWAKFPAPVDAQRVSIVVPHFMPMDDAPIS